MTQNNGSNTNPANRICAEEYVVRRGDSFYLISHKLGVPLRDLLAANRDIHPARLMVGDVLCIPREEDHAVTDNGTVMSRTSPARPTNSTLSDLQAETSNGSNGANGVSGTNGTDGTNGTNGANGTSGANGTNGGNGSNGTNGTNGGNGTNGTNGTNETNGTNGTNGEVVLACPIEEQTTVQAGQTVADIQLRGLVSRNTLSTANPTLDLDNLEPGQVLCVPTENIPCSIPSTYTLAAGESLESVALRYNLPVASVLRANPCLAPQDFEKGVTVILPR